MAVAADAADAEIVVSRRLILVIHTTTIVKSHPFAVAVVATATAALGKTKRGRGEPFYLVDRLDDDPAGSILRPTYVVQVVGALLTSSPPPTACGAPKGALLPR